MRESVRIPYSALSMAQLPHWITYEAGLYDREGLDVTMDYVASSTVLAPALLSREIGLAYAGKEVAIASGVQGGDMVIVGGGIDKPLFWLTTQPGIRGVDELQGKRIGVTRFGASSDTVLRFYLGTVSLQPDRDVSILQMGGNPEMVGGLQSGAIDAAILSPPSVFQAQQNGAAILADMGDLDYPFYQDAVTTTRRFLAERPEVVKRTILGLCPGLEADEGRADGAGGAAKVLRRGRRGPAAADLPRGRESVSRVARATARAHRHGAQAARHSGAGRGAVPGRAVVLADDMAAAWATNP